MTTPKQAFSNAPSIGGVASGASRSAPDWERIELDYRADIKSLRDIAVTGSNVVSDAGTTLQAGRDVTIAAAQETSSEQHYRKETKSGIFGGGGGIGFTIGSRMQSADQTGTHTTVAASTVGSVGGDVNIVAGNAYQQVGSDVMAPGGDVNVVAKEVQIVEARETGNTATEQRFKQSGLSVSIGSPVISAIQTADNMADAARNTGSGRMQALAAAATALNVKNSAGELQGAAQALAGGDPSKAASISISLGSSKSQSNTAQTSDSARGSTVKAGGNVNILAQGAGADNSILVRGSDITAGKYAHRGSFQCLLGDQAHNQALLDKFSIEKHIDAKTPPVFVWHTMTDDAVPVENTLMLIQACRAAGVSIEAHLFPEGSHGLSLANAETAGNGFYAHIVECVQCWPDLAEAWLRRLF